MKSLRIPPISNGPAKIQLSRISHVYFEHPDLDDFARFAEAFGFVQTYRDRNTIYFRGYGKTTFKGAAFVVASEGDFEKACKLPDSTVSQLKGPGGGRKVTIKRLASTFVHVIYGQQERAVPTKVPTATHEDQGPYNHAIEKERKGRFQRYRAGPAMVHKLGHYGENFNSVPSDVLYFPNKPDIDVITFIYLDLGEEYSDHHSIFSQRAPPDIDTCWATNGLPKKSHESVWSVGRHILGSQIFDYWKDPGGFKIEHYADGDVVNSEMPTRRDVVGPLSVWGPELPKIFSVDETKMPLSVA